MGNILISICMIGLLVSFNLNAFGFGIRIQLSDFMLPVLGIIALRQASFRNIIKAYNFRAIILAFTGVLILGAICHWCYFGAINFWGIKKIIGWCICIGYFLVGISLYEKREETIHALIVASWIMGAICLIAASFPETRDVVIYNDLTRLEGLMGNPNAYGIFFAFAMLLQISAQNSLPFQNGTKKIGITILALNLLGTTSRAAWLSFMGAYFIYAFKKNNLKNIIIIFTLFILIFFSAMALIVKIGFFKTYFYTTFQYFSALKGIIETGLVYSLTERLKALLALYSAFLQHPITGIGLGGAMTLHHGQEQYTIHNTALWFLFEMGIIGLAAFTWLVYKLTKALRSSQDIYIKALTLPMLSFAIASLANELFYQRYFWLFAGMIMCDWVRRSQKEAVARQGEMQPTL